MDTAAPIHRVLVGYGSESGNARALAHRLGAFPALQRHAPQVLPFNDIDVTALGAGDVLLALSSSFGDGEPPANGERFAEALRQCPALPGLRYAVFGLGDTGYPQFCGFSKTLDSLLGDCQAQPIMQRVDADGGYEHFFEQWAPVLGDVLDGNPAAGRDLCLQVTAYAEDNAFAAPIIARRRLNARDPAAWHLELDLRGSGIAYRAGDTLHVVAPNDPSLLQALASWYRQSEAVDLLRHKELRLLGKSLLRELARLGGSEPLKDLLRSSQRQALEAYLHGADLLDVLNDHASPDRVPLERLVALLSPCLPRAYSIASAADSAEAALCIREVRYTRTGRERRGTATGWLLEGDGSARVYCRSNPGFHLPRDPDAPLLMVGTGTGIAPLMGLLRELDAAGQQREVHLVFGEKHRDHDYLYQQQLEAWRADGRLQGLHTAFSRDGTAKYYAQHALAEQADTVRDLLLRGAHVYLCGNKQHLGVAVQDAINTIMPAQEGGVSTWDTLQAEGRLHRELY
ncbi:sulfite reductase flavoprotein subunit alpha [Stenotrophomonas rhizophila]|uniref:sulfite reductase flavoprotein subunit alpha n=1 Tax=Stenotrophomonas rhizophila TaxID=216778 RepID=UPI0028D8A267|nr:sulfite reductase flavoprotein subunit alpha [Stenotrophomonas rhizophila]